MNAFFDSSRHPGIPGIALIPGKISGIAGNHEKFPDFFPGIPGMGTPLSPPHLRLKIDCCLKSGQIKPQY